MRPQVDQRNDMAMGEREVFSRLPILLITISMYL